MARPEDVFYRPNIKKPERSFYWENELPPEMRTEPDTAPWKMPEDTPDPYAALIGRFRSLLDKARVLKARAQGLLRLAISDIDGYIGEAPHYILQCIEDLTGLKFGKAPLSDSIYTLPPETINCIFRIAGYYDPNRDAVKLDPSNINTRSFSSQIRSILKDKSYTEAVSYGFKLLLIVIKMCYVIIVHYCVGYPCGWVKGTLDFTPFIPKLGDLLAAILFEPVEKMLLSLIGYKCTARQEAMPTCNDPVTWEKVDIRRVKCCTTEPIFFAEGPTGNLTFNFSECFERWVRDELFPSSAGRSICSPVHANDETIVPTPEEVAKAKVVADYLKEQPPRLGVMNRSDISTLSSAVEASDFAIQMSSQVTSSLDSAKNYKYTGDTGPFDCFGYTPVDANLSASFKKNDEAAANQWTIIERGGYFFEYLEVLDEVLNRALTFADKIVVGTANLAKWGSSRQLCCYVYLMVLISTLVHSLMVKGNICSELSAEGAFADDLRNELRWASMLQGNANVQKFVAILQVIKQIVDMFIQKMNRAIFLAGLKLPLKDMFESIKIVIGNALSQFLDILLSPLDQILTGIKGIPEVRHMINNECFGFDKLLDFLSCALGGLKFGLIDEVMKIFDKFALNDISLIDDIYLSRTRMAFLQALSRLLGSMINLVLGLRDCYDPRVLVDEVVGKVIDDQYNETDKLYELAGTAETMAFIDECAESIMGNTLLPTPERIAELEADPTNLSAAFGELGAVSQHIVSTELLGNIEVKVSEFLTPDGELVESAEFIRRLETMTGVKTREVNESMLYIFDILRGTTNGSA